ncbi:MAG: hypothetical protein ACRBB4_16735 [Neptuniibacter sp.]
MKSLVFFLVSFFSLTTYAAPLTEPTGKVILTVTGNIKHTLEGDTARFDLEQLKQLSSETFTLKTRWSDTTHAYHGPLLSAVLEHVGSKGDRLFLTALNDYSIEIERSYVEKYQPILAWSEDGKPMSVRDKGPLWLLLPHDKYPELNAEVHTGRMIWQLSTIEIK